MSNDIDDLQREVRGLRSVLNYLLAKSGEQVCPGCHGIGSNYEWVYDHSSEVACEKCSKDRWTDGPGVIPLKAKP